MDRRSNGFSLLAPFRIEQMFADERLDVTLVYQNCDTAEAPAPSGSMHAGALRGKRWRACGKLVRAISGIHRPIVPQGSYSVMSNEMRIW